MPPLEALYRRLMFTYPAGYRDEHGTEIVGTLLDVSEPGRPLPSVREAGGLFAGGLRTRARMAARDGRRGIWADGLRLGAAMLVSTSIAQTIWPFLYSNVGIRPRLLPLLLALTAIMLMRRPSRVGLALIAADLVAAWPHYVPTANILYAAPYGPVTLSTLFLSPVLLGLALAAVVFAWYPSARRTYHAWSWWVIAPIVAGPAALVLIQVSAPQMLVWWARHLHLPLTWAINFHLSTTLFELVLPAAVLGALSLIATDPRPSLGGAIYLAVYLISMAPYVLFGVGLFALLPAVGLAAACVAAATLSGRRAAH